MSNSARGWIRIGIVLSVLWLIGVGVSAAIEFKNMKSDLERTIASPAKDSEFEIVGTLGHFVNCSVIGKEAVCRIDRSEFAIYALVPIITAWVSITLLVFAIVWIHAGFGRGST